MSKTLIFVDGGFLSKLSKHFGKGKHLRFDKILFSENLPTRSLQIDEIINEETQNLTDEWKNKGVAVIINHDENVALMVKHKVLTKLNNGNDSNYLNFSGKKKEGSNGIAHAMLIPDCNYNSESKYLNVLVSLVDGCAEMAEWSTQSVDTRYPLGCVTPDLARVIDNSTIVSTTKSLGVQVPFPSVLSFSNSIKQEVLNG